jgi:lipopolysaccharide transport system ATP-binding protein
MRVGSNERCKPFPKERLMMPAIRVENLGKCYRVAHNQQRGGYHTLRDSIVDAVKAPFRRMINGGESGKAEDFWALNDVSFAVQPGEVVGIIGRNGAGKSTLLKILSRITRPTKGRIELNGRVGSLLEIGTGFHPELTGRENIYLNGSILGMRKWEVQRKFDEIVAFAEIETFLDTPVKRYSSGMYVRLAFAVAAHLEPELLIVDEVLAVGDATYQRKCINRMSDLARAGITILFVSHNMELIPRLCSQAILLRSGAVVAIGSAGSVTARYLNEQHLSNSPDDLRRLPRSGDGRARFVRLQLIGQDDHPTLAHESGDDLVIRIEIEANEDIKEVALAVVLSNIHGMRVITSWTQEVDYHCELHRGKQVLDCRFRQVNLRPGRRMQIGLWMATHNVIDCVEQAGMFNVIPSATTGHLSTDAQQGVVVCNYSWSRVDPDAELGSLLNGSLGPEV